MKKKIFRWIIPIAITGILAIGTLAFFTTGFSRKMLGAQLASLPLPTPPTLCLKNGPPSIHLIYPNGGETLVAGQTITVKWTTCNIPSSDYLVPLINKATSQYPNLFYYSVALGDEIGDLSNVVQNTGQATITIPPDNSYYSAFYAPNRQNENGFGKYFQFELEHIKLVPGSVTPPDAYDVPMVSFTINQSGIIFQPPNPAMQ